MIFQIQPPVIYGQNPAVIDKNIKGPARGTWEVWLQGIVDWASVQILNGVER